jgi:hypothetical protein
MRETNGLAYFVQVRHQKVFMIKQHSMKKLEFSTFKEIKYKQSTLPA